jgi:hypothetical protein
LNKAQKDVLKASLNDEKKTIRELKQVYRQAKMDIEDRIRELSSRTDMENIQSIIYQKKYQEALKKQLDDVLDKLDSNQFNTISDYLKTCYENGYIGNMYDLQHQGISLTIPINQKKVTKAIQTDTKLSSRKYKGNPLKGRLEEDIDRLKTSIRAELSRSVANGSSWNEVAVKIATGMNNPFDVAYRDALLIARTEGHRIQQSAMLDSMHEAKDKGADIIKQWDSTLDGATRPAHRQADGQIRELDEDFDVWGEKLKAPSIGGSARNVCNCRCQLLQRARWSMDEAELETLKKRAEYFGLDKTESFDDFKKKYLKLPENADTIKLKPSAYFHDVSGTTTKIKGALSDEDYQEYLEMIQKNPDIAPLYDTADQIGKVTFKEGSGCCWGSSRLEFGFPNPSYIQSGMNKYSTLAHEYGHFFDTRKYDGLTHDEFRGLHRVLQLSPNTVASSSDQFLSAMRKDAEYITKNIAEVKQFCTNHRNTSTGIQDAVDGLGLGRIWWGHGDRYYNRFYNARIKDSNGWIDYTKEVKEYYKSLGFDASNQVKVKKITRHYETASELWGNIASAITCGGEELESMKKYFPETVEAFIQITGKLVK